MSKIYNDSMFPAGWSVAGTATIVTDWYTLGNQIIKNIDNKKIDDANIKIKTFQEQFLDNNPGNTDIAEVANKVNKAIDNANLKSTTHITRLK